MNKFLIPLLFSVTVSYAQTTIKYYSLPKTNAYRTRVPTGEPLSESGSPYTLIPNPATHTIQIRNVSASAIEAVLLYDITGRKVKNIENDFERIDLSNLGQGLYIVQIHDAAKKVSIHKIL